MLRAKHARLAQAHMLHMNQNLGTLIPKSLSLQAAFGESVCWITPFEDGSTVEDWRTLGFGDPEWLWRHEALVFGAHYMVSHLPSKADVN
jgi:hypothetical protein